MDAAKAEQLASAVAAIQKRWGARALDTLGNAQRAADRPALPTGIPDLDAVLEGGLPRGALTLVAGPLSSGRATLALRVLAAARGPMAYVDFATSFDPDYAERCGVDLSRLLLVRPDTMADGLDLAAELIARYGVGLLVLDQTLWRRHPEDDPAALATGVRRLAALVRASSAAVLCLPPLHGVAVHLQAHAALVLQLARARWLRHHGEIVGFEARVTVVKHRAAPVGRAGTIAIRCK